MDERPERNETPTERADRELLELLNELRVVLPGITVLFAFLLAVPFGRGWAHVTDFERDVFLVAVLSTGVAIVCLTAPSSYHRLRFHRGEKQRLVVIGNRLAIAGIAAFAVALLAAILLAVTHVTSRAAGIAAAAGAGTLLFVLWYGLPAYAAVKARRAR